MQNNHIHIVADALDCRLGGAEYTKQSGEFVHLSYFSLHDNRYDNNVCAIITVLA